jgi:hypothetical protein
MTASPSNPSSEPAAAPLSPEVQSAATTALILEIVFGLFSLFGIGHVYSGRLGLGLALMVGWWVYIAAAGFISTLTGGLAGCLAVPIYIAAPIFSGIQASAYVKKVGATGSWRSVAFVAGGGCLLIAGTICLLSFFGVISLGFLTALFSSQQ